MEIIWSMIGRIDLHEGKDPGKSDVIHVRALAQNPLFTQQRKTAASNGSDGRVLIVEGVGIEPTTFRL